jgi:hypothetical protein
MEGHGCDIFSWKLPEYLRKTAKYHSPTEIRASPEQKINVISLSKPAKNDDLVSMKAPEDKVEHICVHFSCGSYYQIPAKAKTRLKLSYVCTDLYLDRFIHEIKRVGMGNKILSRLVAFTLYQVPGCAHFMCRRRKETNKTMMTTTTRDRI